MVWNSDGSFDELFYILAPFLTSMDDIGIGEEWRAGDWFFGMFQSNSVAEMMDYHLRFFLCRD